MTTSHNIDDFRFLAEFFYHQILFSFYNLNMLPLLSLERDGRCATTSMSAGQTLGCPKVLLPCWTSVSMYFRGGRRQSRALVPVGWDLQAAPLLSCTAVLVSAAQVNTFYIFFFFLGGGGVAWRPCISASVLKSEIKTVQDHNMLSPIRFVPTRHFECTWTQTWIGIISSI